jgi:hypothetical protein
MRIRLAIALGLTACVVLLPQISSASVVTYTSSSAFLSAITTTQIENYGTLSNGQLISSGSTIHGLTYNSFNLTSGATNLIITNLFNSFSGLSLGADHTAFGSDITFFFPGEGATIVFSSPVTAFGMWFNVGLNTGLYGFTSSVGSAFTGSTVYDTPTFVFAGMASDTPFSSISFNSTDPNLGTFNVPEVVLGNSRLSAPEPATLDLVLAAGLLLGGAGYGWRRIRGFQG